MTKIVFDIEHKYQSTNNNCSQTALSMLLSNYGVSISPDEIMSNIPVHKHENGEDWGSITQQLATWCISQGFNVEMHTFEFQIIDFSWKEKSNEEILKRLNAVKDAREDILSLGKEWSKLYVESYIDFIEAGGTLHIEDYPSTDLINKLLENGPIFATISYQVLHGSGRKRTTGIRESVEDDIKGKVTNHSIVISGRDENKDYIIQDPWKKPCTHKIEPERLINAITAAQIEADNLIFQISK